MVGAGEVGTAVAAVLSRAHPTQLRDIEPVEVEADVLDVCIPWSERFVEIVAAYVVQHRVRLVVVHSTVPVGVCDAQGWVHSPIRGRHPDLTEGVATFVKHFGGVGAEEAALAWKDCGVPTAVHPRAAETEAGKLWELVQFGVQVRMEKAVHAWCEERGLDPEVVYAAFAHTYNSGYEQLGFDILFGRCLNTCPAPSGATVWCPWPTCWTTPPPPSSRKGLNADCRGAVRRRHPDAHPMREITAGTDP